MRDLRRRQILFHGLMCYPQLLVALLQFQGPFRNQWLELMMVTNMPIGFWLHSRRFVSSAIAVSLASIVAISARLRKADLTADWDAAMNKGRSHPLARDVADGEEQHPVRRPHDIDEIAAHLLRRSHPRIGGEGAQLGISFPHQSVLHDLRRRQILFHGLMCYPQLLVALLQFPGPFRNQCLELFLAVEDLKGYRLMSLKTRAKLPISSVLRITGSMAPGSGCSPVSTSRAASAMISIGCVSNREPKSAATAVRPSSANAIKAVFHASPRTASAMSSRLTAMAKPPIRIPPVLVDDRGCDHDAAVIG